MFRTVLLAASATGCHLVFPLETVSQDAPDPPIGPVEIEIFRVAVSNNAARAPMPTTIEYRPASLVVQLEDGSLPTVRETAVGRYEFETPNLPYTITIDDPIGFFALDHKVPHVEIGLHQLGRVGTPFVDPVPVTVQPTGGATFASQLVHTTGIWSTAALDFEWGGRAHSLFGPRGLLDVAQNDRLYWVGYQIVSDSSGGHKALTDFAEAGITLQEGVPKNVQVVPVPAPPLCASISAARGAERARIETVAPGNFNEPNGDYLLDAIPARELGLDAAMLIAQQGSLNDLAKTEIKYGNPFPGALSIASLFASKVRAFMPPGATSLLRVSYATRVYVEPIPDSQSCPGHFVDLPAGMVGLVSSIKFEEVNLTSDTLEIPIGDTVTVTWSVTPEPIDHFLVKLFELEVAGPGTTNDPPEGTPSLKVIATRNTVVPRAVFPGELFEPGRHYMIGIDGLIGFADAATGGFLKVGFPNGNSTATSSLFAITR